MEILTERKHEGGGRGRGPLVGVALLVAVVAIGTLSWVVLKRPSPRASPTPPPAAKARRPPVPKATPAPVPVPGATTGTLEIEAGRSARVKARLEPEAAVLRVDADVPGANVFLDRKFLGTTPVETRELTPGTHRLNVSAEGYDMYAETIEIADGRSDLLVRFKEVRLDEKLPVVHKHGMGSCNGLLVATTGGLRYEGSPKGDAFTASFASLEPLQVDYLKKNLRVKLKGGKTYNFTGDNADALLTFQKAVEAARKRL